MTTPSTDCAATPELPESGDAGLSHGVRTTVNLLLFVHLFSLGALCLFNGSELGLRQQLRRVPGYYLQLLGMDLDFDSGQRVNWELQTRDRPLLPESEEAPRTVRSRLSFLQDHLMEARGGEIHKAEKDVTALIDKQKENPREMSRRGLFHLTFADPLDWAHFIEFRYHHDGEERTVGLPAFQRTGRPFAAVAALPSTVGWQGFWPRQRYLRYQMLAREVGRLASLENVQDILPAAITEALLTSEGITLDELRSLRPSLACRRVEQPSTIQIISVREGRADTWVADPWDMRWFHTAYQRTPVAVGGRIHFSGTSGLRRDYTPAVEEPSASKSRL